MKRDLLRHQPAPDVWAGVVALVDVHPPRAQRSLACALKALGNGNLVPDLPVLHERQLLRARGRNELGGQLLPRVLVPNCACAELQQHLGLVVDLGLVRHRLDRLIFGTQTQSVNPGARGPRPCDAERVVPLAPALVLDAAEYGSAQAARVHRRGRRTAVKEPHVRMVA